MLARGSIVGCQVLSPRHKNPVSYFSPSRLQGVGTFAERQKGGRTTRVRAHENKTTRKAGGSPEIPSHRLLRQWLTRSFKGVILILKSCHEGGH